MKSLVIVESPAKAKTINKYLGSDYIVEASLGHVKDLPKGGISIDIDKGFVPTYEVIDKRKDVVERLRNLARNCGAIYLATDPDREGEAIAQHIADEVKGRGRKISRVVFNEITRSGVTNAMRNPRSIDKAMVDAQEARRVMDRLIGYQVSPFLWRSFRGESKGLSAGRVQSVALRLVVEREKAINSFIPIEYWNLHGHFMTKRDEEIVARLVKVGDRDIRNPSGSASDLQEAEQKAKENGKDVPRSFISTKAEAEALRDRILKEEYAIKKIDRKEVKRNAPPPFTTSTLQQDGGRRLRINSKKVMQLAQKLYEGVEIGPHGRVGLITYMRTDSVRVSDEAAQMAEEFIYEQFGKEYLPPGRTQFKQKAQNVQDAHEAIRPTDLKITPRQARKHLDDDLANLYELIYRRFVASQMAAAVFDQTVVDIEGGEFLFRATGRILRFSGWMKVLDDGKKDLGTPGRGDAGKKNNGDDDDSSSSGDDEDRVLPAGIKRGEELKLEKVDLKQSATKPPPRYTESLLVKEMEAKGIGRPSTYAATISTIQDRGYVEQKMRRLYATELGIRVSDLLVEQFPSLFDVKFTARMESDLDTIASGTSTYLKVMQGFYRPFQRSLKAAGIGEKTGITEGSRQRARQDKLTRGKKGTATGTEVEKKGSAAVAAPEMLCDKCDAPMVLRQGKNGEFYGCSDYPTCRNTRPVPTGITCPECDKGDIVERVGGRYSSVFHGCSRYPDCRFTSTLKPVNKPCKNCDSKYLVEAFKEGEGEFLECPRCRVRAN